MLFLPKDSGFIVRTVEEISEEGEIILQASPDGPPQAGFAPAVLQRTETITLHELQDNSPESEFYITPDLSRVLEICRKET